MMNFRKFFESIDFDSKEVIVKKGEILFHGTSSSFDTRKISPGGDDIFWTTDSITIARMYIPNKSRRLFVTPSYLLSGKNYENIRKSLGITKSIINLAFKKQEFNYQTYLFLQKKNSEFLTKSKELEDNDEPIEDFFNAWKTVSNEYEKAKKNLKVVEDYLSNFLIQKMKTFGYELDNGGYNDIMTDSEGNLLHNSVQTIGKVLKLTCQRDFKFYNYAYGKEGDLQDVDYNKFSLFRKIEEQGYDGIIINDFAQSNHYGNYGHFGIGFFKSSVKDLSVKQIRSQTHPKDSEFD